ncbi:hypothetical protein BDQ12DRAFT_637405 [Crucibulum laeve]|uniref:SnoaL-like domain-containing protein n=1 Tax=Crucibulum laeve TaxID=68775 RepID=A0A5C3LMQ5_9AGAR|nr:hypothetical protein BDQ12DRAFT_637405 [Crucibulum laeve]
MIDAFNPSQTPSYAFTPPLNPSPNMRTFLAYLKALNTWDYDECMAVFDDSLEHWILPKSLGRPVLNKKQYGEYFKVLMPTFSGIEFSIQDIIETADKMTVHASSKGTSTLGTPYNNEYILILHFTSPLIATPSSEASGEWTPKIKLLKEFVDSAVSIKFFTEDRAKITVKEREKEKA